MESLWKQGERVVVHVAANMRWYDGETVCVR
jgi:hypothetical protein